MKSKLPYTEEHPSILGRKIEVVDHETGLGHPGPADRDGQQHDRESVGVRSIDEPNTDERDSGDQVAHALEEFPHNHLQLRGQVARWPERGEGGSREGGQEEDGWMSG